MESSGSIFLISAFTHDMQASRAQICCSLAAGLALCLWQHLTAGKAAPRWCGKALLVWLARKALPESKAKLVHRGLLWCVWIPGKTRDVLPLHREREAASACGCEVGRAGSASRRLLGTPPVLLTSEKERCKAEAAGATMLCWSQCPGPLGLADQLDGAVWGWGDRPKPGWVGQGV